MLEMISVLGIKHTIKNMHPIIKEVYVSEVNQNGDVCINALLPRWTWVFGGLHKYIKDKIDTLAFKFGRINRTYHVEVS